MDGIMRFRTLIVALVILGHSANGQHTEDLSVDEDIEIVIQEPIVTEPAIVNNSEYSVTLLFDQYDRRKAHEDNYEGYLQPHTVNICSDSLLTFSFSKEALTVNATGISRSISGSIDCKNQLNGKIKYGDDPDRNPYEPDSLWLNLNQWKVHCFFRGMRCLDTGDNSLSIEGKEGILSFNKLHNIYIVDYDSDFNGKTELYILSIQYCAELLRLYRIE